MEFIKLDKQDLALILEQLKAAARWLDEKNIDYWQNWHNPSALHKNWIKVGLERGQFYQVYENNRFLGIFRLQYSDELFWGEKNDRAGYIHSFTTNRRIEGRGIGYRILDKVVERLRAEGCRYLRLDCGVKNAKLIRYYKNYGFEEAGEVVVHNEELLLLEKEL